jgi:peroxiredoxin
LKAKLAEHDADGLVVIGVLTDDPPDPARQFIADQGATWATVSDPNGAIKQAYRVVARPQSYFIDRDGILRSIQIGEVGDADFERQFDLIKGGG